MTTKLREWLRLAAPEERETLAEIGGTSVGHLSQMGGGWRENPKLGLALRLHFGTRLLHIRTKKRLPILELTDFARFEDLPTKKVLKEIGEENIVLY